MFACNESVTMKFSRLLSCLRISTMLCQISGLILLFILAVAAAYLNREMYLKDKAICNLPVHYGNCGVKVTNWYYNPKERACLRFQYGLCGGNLNRFYTWKECSSLCRGMY